MAKRKPSKRKFKKRVSPKSQVMDMRDLDDNLVETYLQEIKEDITSRKLNTDFGEITIHPEALFLVMSKKALGAMLMDDDYDEEDDLERLLFLEKMIERFPNEPDFAHGRFHVYLRLDKIEKAKKLNHGIFN